MNEKFAGQKPRFQMISKAVRHATGALVLGLLVASAGAATGNDPGAAPPIKRSLKAYQTPVVDVMGASGRPMRLGKVIDDGRPVVLTFSFTQ